MNFVSQIVQDQSRTDISGSNMFQEWSRSRSRSGDSSVVRAPGPWSNGPQVRIPEEAAGECLLQGQLSVLTLILVSVPPPCYGSSV